MLTKTIVLTGGPCGGKTTLLQTSAQLLREMNYQVFTIPERVTLLRENGLPLSALADPRVQAQIIAQQISAEDDIKRLIALSDKPAVILCDRGTTDQRAYVAQQQWLEILKDNRWGPMTLREQRYDAIFHLVTAADGAEEHYSLDNAARYETPEAARVVCQNLQSAWLGHPHLRVIENCAGGLIAKGERLVKGLLAVVQAKPLEIERKFLVSKVPDVFPVPFQDINIEQIYLPDGRRLRRRTQASTESLFYQTIKKQINPHTCEELETPIAEADFLAAVASSSANLPTIVKQRRHFIYQHRHFELDNFVRPHAGLQLLEIELDDEAQSFELPNFLTIEREVTGDPQYSNRYLANHPDEGGASREALCS